jgi:hypothetical protein
MVNKILTSEIEAGVKRRLADEYDAAHSVTHLVKERRAATRPPRQKLKLKLVQRSAATSPVPGKSGCKVMGPWRGFDPANLSFAAACFE